MGWSLHPLKSKIALNKKEQLTKIRLIIYGFQTLSMPPVPCVFPFKISAEIFGWDRNLWKGFGFGQAETEIWKLEFGFGLTETEFRL